MSRLSARQLAPLDRESDVPAYRQIAAELTRAIEDGTVNTGDKLPSESDLCRRFEVARMTVRQALDLLKSEDLIYSEQGRGVFVQGISNIRKLPLFAVPSWTPLENGNLPFPGTYTSEFDEQILVTPSQRVWRANESIPGGSQKIILELESSTNWGPFEIHRYSLDLPGGWGADATITERAIDALERLLREVRTVETSVISRVATSAEQRRLALQSPPQNTVLMIKRIGYSGHNRVIRCESVRSGNVALEARNEWSFPEKPAS